MLVVTVFMAIFLFSACSKADNSEYDELLNQLQGEFDGQERDFDRYIVVIPSDASAALYSATEAMTKKIEQNTETEAVLVYDYEKVAVGAEDCEILVGDTSRNESQSFLKKYRIDDFGYKYFDGKIVVGGICEESTLLAVDKFTQDVVDYADKELFMSPDKSYFYRGDYSVERITLCGFELCDYTVLYDGEIALAQELALDFRNAIAESTGYYLRVKKTSEVSDGVRAICIGDTDRLPSGGGSLEENEAGIFSCPTGICIGAQNSFGYRLAVDRLLLMLCTGEGDSCDVTIADSIDLSFTSTELSLLRVFSSSAELSVEQTVELTEKAKAGGAGIISVYGVSEATAENIRLSAGNGFEKKRIFGDELNGAYHIYSSRFEFVELGQATLSDCDVVELVYKTAQTDAGFCVVELDAADCASTTLARYVAERLDSLEKLGADNTVIVNSCFENEADHAFGAALGYAERIGGKSEGEIRGYLGGDSADVRDYRAESRGLMKYEQVSIILYSE